MKSLNTRGSKLLFVRSAVIVCLLTAAMSVMPVQAAPNVRHYYESRGDVVWEVPSREKQVALTFDDGPDPADTPLILDLLKKYDAKATFFVMGLKAKKHPEIVQRAAAEGHELANHTYTHRMLDSSFTAEQIRKEIVDTQETIFEATGVRARLFRPPGGLFNPRMIAVGKEEGLQMVLWSWHQDTHDWSRPGVNRIVRKVLNNVRSGDIILLHDYVHGPTQTVEALSRILPALQGQGYRFVTVSELLYQSSREVRK